MASFSLKTVKFTTGAYSSLGTSSCGKFPHCPSIQAVALPVFYLVCALMHVFRTRSILTTRQGNTPNGEHTRTAGNDDANVECQPDGSPSEFHFSRT